MLANGLQEIVFGAGDQPLVHLPPTLVSSATYQVEDLHQGEEDDDRFIVVLGAATVDALSTTTSAAAGRGEADAYVLTVASTAGTSVGQHLEIASSAGTEVRKIDYAGGTTIRLTQPLRLYHPTGATVRGIEISGEFPSASAADEDLFDSDSVVEVTWIYEIGDVPIRASEQIRMVRSSFSAPHIGAVEQTLRATHSTLVRQLDPTGESLREIIQDATEQIELKLRAKGYDPSTFLAGRTGFQLVKAKTLETIAENGIHPPGFDAPGFLDHMAAHVARAMNNLHGRPPLDTADVDRSGNTVAANRSLRTGGVRRA